MHLLLPEVPKRRRRRGKGRRGGPVEQPIFPSGCKFLPGGFVGRDLVVE